MAKNTCEVISSTFKSLCYIATISVIIFWMHKCYYQDDDLCLVDYSSIKEDDVSLPVLSLCFENPFSEEKLKKISPSLNRSYYLEYLRGNVIDENLTRVDYEDVSIKLLDHLVEYEARLNNGSRLRFKKLSPYQHPIYVTYNGFFLSTKVFVKCFGHSARNEYRKDLQGITTTYDFPKGFGKHYISIHYPNQLLATCHMTFFTNEEQQTEVSTRFFDIHEMEVLKRRNKRKFSCLDFDDEFIFDEHVQKELNQQRASCRPPYQNYDRSRPICSTMADMKKAVFIFNEDFDDKFHPCESMSSIRHETQNLIKPRFLNPNNESQISLMIPKKARVIRQSKAIDTNSLIGYVGGYIGVLLGR